MLKPPSTTRTWPYREQMGACALGEPPQEAPHGRLTEQRTYEDDDLNGGGELAVQLRLAELPESAAVGARRLSARLVARLAGVSGNPGAVMPHGESGGPGSAGCPPPSSAPVSPAPGLEGQAGAWCSPGEPGAAAGPLTSPHRQPRRLGGGEGGE